VEQKMRPNEALKKPSISVDFFKQKYYITERRPNLNLEIVNNIAEKTGIQFSIEKKDDETAFTPMDIFDCIYAVLYSNNYRAKYQSSEIIPADYALPSSGRQSVNKA
jgi:hypothetical protein